MNIEVDTHTHTVLSGHAHSTILENAAAAAKLGLAGLVMTEHGPIFPSAPPEFNVTTYRYLPTHMEGVRLYGGIEANIIDYEGGIDLGEKYLVRLQFVIAGLHLPVLTSGGLQKDTDTAIAALSNKHVDMISHPDHPGYQLDYQALAKEAARLGKILEVNSQSLEYRKGTIENADKMVRWCKKYGVRVAVSSDAHSAYGIGRFETALRVLAAGDFPEELVINVTQTRFEDYLEERAQRIGA